MPRSVRSKSTIARGNGHLRNCWHCGRQRNHELMRRLVRGLWVCQDKESCGEAKTKRNVDKIAAALVNKSTSARR